jgi:hypothetical protein
MTAGAADGQPPTGGMHADAHAVSVPQHMGVWGQCPGGGGGGGGGLVVPPGGGCGGGGGGWA